MSKAIDLTRPVYMEEAMRLLNLSSVQVGHYARIGELKGVKRSGVWVFTLGAVLALKRKPRGWPPGKPRKNTRKK